MIDCTRDAMSSRAAAEVVSVNVPSLLRRKGARKRSGGIVLVGELPTLDARVALKHGVIQNAANGHNFFFGLCSTRVDLDINFERARRMAETTKRLA